jgi:hypothetical protein
MKLKLTILPLCLIVLNAFGFEGTIKQSVTNYNGTGTNVAMTWYIGAHSCRLDMTATGKDVQSGNSVLLLDPSAKTLRTYEAAGSAEHIYYEVPAAAISGTASDVSVTKTNDTKQIQGYKCEKWSVTSGGASYDIWITRDIDFDAASYKDFFKASIEIQALAQQGVRGFPMLTESKTGANASSVQSISPRALSGETFTVPSDYKLFVAQQAAAPAKPKK